MRILLLGVSHHTAPIDLRERLSFAPDRIAGALGEIAQQAGIGETVLLSTCNRTEMYVTCDDMENGRERLARFLTEYHSLDPRGVEPHLYTRHETDAVRHLFRVAAGLDSLVVGEPQILGQVKQAFGVATQEQRTGAMLNRLFHQAFTVGKRVRAETGLADGAVSVSFAALGLARKICGEIKGLTALVLGAGDMAALTARHLQGQQPGRLLITSRTPAHAEELANDVGGQVIPWADADRALAAADIVVSATGATKPIVTADRVRKAMKGRTMRPLFIIDIAVPRDVEAAAGDLEQVFLYNIDDLQGIVSENLAKRANEVARAESIVGDEVEAFLAWTRSRAVVPTVVALRRRFEAIRQSELTRLQPKLAGLPPEAAKRVDEITRLIMEKLLSTPTEQLKSLDNPETIVAFSDALNQLFALNADQDQQDRGGDAAQQQQSDRDGDDRDTRGPSKPNVAVQS
jgi:glutamyl-tRNA reductase